MNITEIKAALQEDLRNARANGLVITGTPIRMTQCCALSAFCLNNVDLIRQEPSIVLYAQKRFGILAHEAWSIINGFDGKVWDDQMEQVPEFVRLGQELAEEFVK